MSSDKCDYKVTLVKPWVKTKDNVNAGIAELLKRMRACLPGKWDFW